MREETNRMEAAGKNNTKLTLLSIYKECLGGFMSKGKQVLREGEQ